MNRKKPVDRALEGRHPQEALEDLQIRLNEALQALPHETRMAVILNDIEGFPKKEIAGVLSISEKKVEKRLSGAYRQLEKSMGRELKHNELLDGKKLSMGELLRFKKLETPGEEYFKHFLPEFHRYQRALILEQPNRWTEFFEGLSGFVFSIPRPVAAMATAMAVFAAVAVIHPLTGGAQSADPTFVSVPKMDRVVEDVFPAEKKNFVDVSAPESLLQQSDIQRDLPLTEEHHDMSTPRYVTGNTASSYDTTLAF